MNPDLIARIRARASNPKTIHDMARGMSPAPKVFPPATPEQIATTEAALGFALPPLFKQILAEIGNGGFGPGYGLFGVDGGHPDYDHKSMAEVYAQTQSPTAHGDFPLLPEKIVPVCNWGCGIYSCLDCREPDAPVYFFNPDLHVLDDENLEAQLTNADGKRVWTYSRKKSKGDQPQEQTRLFLQMPSLKEMMTAWTQRVKLWDAMENIMGSL